MLGCGSVSEIASGGMFRELPQQGQESDVDELLGQQAIVVVDDLESGESTKSADDITGQSKEGLAKRLCERTVHARGAGRGLRARSVAAVTAFHGDTVVWKEEMH